MLVFDLSRWTAESQRLLRRCARISRRRRASIMWAPTSSWNMTRWKSNALRGCTSLLSNRTETWCRRPVPNRNSTPLTTRRVGHLPALWHKMLVGLSRILRAGTMATLWQISIRARHPMCRGLSLNGWSASKIGIQRPSPRSDSQWSRAIRAWCQASVVPNRERLVNCNLL